MPLKQRSCPHVHLIDMTPELVKSKRREPCHACSSTVQNTNTWLCLQKDCLFVGCGENQGKGADHSGQHHTKQGHFVALNLRNRRMWCYVCQQEVHLLTTTASGEHQKSSQETSPTSFKVNKRSEIGGRSGSFANINDVDLEIGSDLLAGLTGLSNLGNTCYMNAALQSLSNCPQLTNYLLTCRHVVNSSPEERHGMSSISESFSGLIRRLWSENRSGMVSPVELTTSVKTVLPAFRGHTQQDSQEFLRCFMDRLHEDMKEVVERPYGARRRQRSDATNDNEEDSGEESDLDDDDDDDDSEDEREEETAGRSDVDDAERVDPRGEDEERSSSAVRSASGEAGAAAGDASDAGAVTMSDRDAEDGLAESPQAGDTAATARTAKRGATSPNVSVAHPMVSSPTPPKKKRHTQYRSIISDVFDGKLLSSVQCRTCERVSSRKETFQDLSLPIPSREHVAVLQSRGISPSASGSRNCGEIAPAVGQSWLQWIWSWFSGIFSAFMGPNVALQDCLSAFFSEDELEGDNMYSCEKCKKLRNGRKYSRLLRLPEILCIHLKRFRHDFTFSSKISTFVSFPLEDLDISPYLARDAEPSGSGIYDLVSVVVHTGTAGGGHYIAYALNLPTDKWFEFDDETVTEVNPQVVENAEAYVLFYRKRQGDEILKQRKEAAHLVNHVMRQPNESLMRFYISSAWLSKFETFSDPGPISNDDFLCRHGAVRPNKFPVLKDIVKEVSELEWNYYQRNFGGGPVATHLQICSVCEKRNIRLRRRQEREWTVMLRLNDEFRKYTSTNICAINRRWFVAWERFAKGRTNEPPGPIDNASISYCRNGQLVIRQSSGYGHISEDMWNFLHRRYGGGPLLISQRLSPTRHSSPSPPASRYRSYSFRQEVTRRESGSQVDQGDGEENEDEGRRRYDWYGRVSNTYRPPANSRVGSQHVHYGSYRADESEGKEEEDEEEEGEDSKDEEKSLSKKEESRAMTTGNDAEKEEEDAEEEEEEEERDKDQQVGPETPMVPSREVSQR